jgi:alkylglycerol monooxygenase
MLENFWVSDLIGKRYAAMAIPTFFLFVGLEYAATKRGQRKKRFNFESSVTNITIAIAERSLSLFVTTSFYTVFVWIHDHLRFVYGGQR